jgi:hypothetical protein
MGAAQSRFRLLHHAPNFLSRSQAYRSGALLASHGVGHESGMGVARPKSACLTRSAPGQSGA